MDRLILFVFACTAQVGCHAPSPSLDPFALYGPTRVPPPPTGVVGRPDGYYRPQPQAQAPPPLYQGSTYSPPQSTPVQQQTPWRSPTPATTARQPSDTDQIGPVGQSPPTEYNDRLSWVVPSSRYTLSPTGGIAPIAATAVPSYDGAVVVSDPLDPYRAVDACCVPETVVHGVPVPIPQSATIPSAGQIISYGPPQIVSNSSYPVAPPRIRGFANSGVRRIRIPAGLSVVSDQVVQTADSSWKSRTPGDSTDTRSRY